MSTFDYDRMFSNYDAVSAIANAGDAMGGSGKILEIARPNPNAPQQDNNGMREMTGTERLFASLANLGQSMAGSTGFGEYYQKNGGLKSLATPEGAVRFAMNLPAGMASALPSGVANLYAAGTGANVTYGADLANNQISSKELDAGQRVASGVTGLIDTAGLAFGGSGSLLNEFGRAWKAGRGIEAAKNTGAGLNILRGTGSSMANRGVMTTGQAFAFDVAEEAGEEFVQSLSEDVIQEQLDNGSLGRALEGGFMGALGGGIMSGAALGMRSLTNESIEKATPPTQTPTDKNNFKWYDELLDKNVDNGISHATRAMSQLARDESLKEYIKKKPGSAAAMFRSTGKYQGFDDMGLTVSEIRNVAAQNDASFKKVLAWFNGGDVNNGILSEQDFKKYLTQADQDNAAEELWKCVQRAYGPDGEAKIALLRNPATSEGIVWARVKGITSGRGFDLSPQLAKAVGGDYDSDRGAVFFDIKDTGMDPVVWASDLLLRNEDQSGTKPSTKFQFPFTSMTYAADDTQRTHQRDAMRAELVSLVGKLAPGTTNDALIDDVVDRVFSAYDVDPRTLKDGDDERDINIAQALVYLKQQFDGAYSPDGSGKAGRDAMTSVFSAFATYRDDPVQTLAKDLQDDFVKQITGIVASAKEDVGTGGVVTPGSSTSLGTAFSPFEMGMPDWFTAENRQQFYRSYATAVYQWAKAHSTEQRLFSDTFDVNGQQISAWGLAIVWGCHMVAAGSDPSDAIVEMTSELIRAEYNERFGADPQAVDNWDTMKDRLDAFQEIYRKWAKVKNEAMKELRNDMYITSPGASEWNENLDYDTNSNQFCSEWLRIMGDNTIGTLIPPEYFGTGVTSFVEIKSIKSTICDIAAHGYSMASLSLLTRDSDGGLYRFVDNLVKSVQNEGSRIEKVVRNFLETVDVSKLVERAAAGEDLDPRDVAAWMKFSEMLEYCSNMKAWMAAGLIDPKNWVDTAIGRKLTSRSVDDRLTAIVAANFLGKFRFALEARAQGREFRAEEEDKLDDLANIDILHRSIVADLRGTEEQNGKTRSYTLERLLDLDESFESKRDWISDVFAKEDGTLNGSLLLSSMQSPVDEGRLALDTSIMTQIKQARTAASEYQMLLWDNAKAEVDTLTTYVTTQLVDDDLFRRVFGEQCLKAVTSISLDPLCAMIADGANFSNHQPEKGTTIYSSSHYYVQVDFAENGDQTSFLTDKFSNPLGSALIDDVLSNPQIILRLLSDDSIAMRVFDNDGRNVLLTRDAVYESICGSDYSRNTGPTVKNVLKVLQEYPTLITYLGGIDTSSKDSLGGPKDTHSRSKTFLNVLKDEKARQTNNTDGQVERHAIDLQVAKIKNALLGDMRTASYIFSCLPDEQKSLVEAGYRPSKTTVEKILDKMARGVYAERARSYVKTTGSAPILAGYGERKFNERFTDAMLSRLQKFSNLVSRGVARNASQLANAAQAYQSKNLYQDCADNYFFNVFINEGESLGFENSNDEILLAAAHLTLGHAVGAPAVSPVEDIAALHLAVADIIGNQAMTRTQQEVYTMALDQVRKWLATGEVSIAKDQNGNDVTTVDNIARELTTRFTSRIEAAKQYLIPVSGNLIDDSGHKYPAQLQVALDKISDFCNDKGSTDEEYRNNEIIDKFKAIPDGAAVQDYTSFVLLLNAPIIARVVNNYQENVAGSANSAIGRDYSEALDYIQSFVSDPRYIDLFDDSEIISSEHLANYLKNGGFDEAIKEFPVPDFSDRKSALYARQLLEITSSGRVVTEVGRNGMENAELFGIDMTPVRTLPFVTGEVTTWGDLKARTDSTIDRRYVRRLENGQPTQDEPITIGELKSSQTPPADNVQYELFDPRANPHGVHLGPLMAPAMGKYAKGYKGVIAALNRMQMESMEEMVLKVRKNFGKKGDFTLVRSRRGKSVLENGSNKMKKGDTATTDAARKAYEEFVEIATDAIMKTPLYNSELSGIGIGKDEIRALVQMMTPGIEFTYKENGKTKHRLIDVMHLYKGDYETELAKLGDSIVSAEVYMVPLQVISRKVEDGCIVANKDQTDDEFEDSAYKAMTEWDSWEINTLGIDEVLHRIPPLGRTYNNLHAEVDLTAVQKLYQDVMGVKVNNFARNHPAALSANYKWDGKIAPFAQSADTMDREQKTAWNAYETARGLVHDITNIHSFSTVLNNIQEFGANVNICRVFGSEFNWATEGIDHGLRTALSELGNSTWHRDGDSVLLLSDNDDIISEAIAYAATAKKDILVPKPLYKGDAAGLETSLLSFDGAKKGEYSSQEFYLIPYTEMVIAPHARFGASRVREQRVNPTQYYTTILLDALGEFPGIGDSVTLFLEKAAKKFGTYTSNKPASISLSAFLSKTDQRKYGFDTLSEADIEALKNIDIDDDTAWGEFQKSFEQIDAEFYDSGGEGHHGKKISPINMKAYRKAVKRCLTSMVKAKNSSNIPLKGLRGGECASIVKVVDAAGKTVRYIPVIIPKNVGEINDGSVIFGPGKSSVEISYDEAINFATSDKSEAYAKWNIATEAAVKSMVSFVKKFSRKNCSGFDGVHNFATLSSRLKGRDVPVLYTNLHRKMMENYMHFILEWDSTNEKYQLASWMRNKNQEYIQNTINGVTSGESLWADILANKLPSELTTTWSDDELSNVSRVLRKVIKQSNLHGIRLMSVFGAGNITVDYNSPTLDVKICASQWEPDIAMAFDGLSHGDVIDFFSFIGQNQIKQLCQRRNDTTPSDENATFLFDKTGKMRVVIGGTPCYRQVFVGPVQYMGHSSNTDTFGNEASVSLQQRLDKYSMYGLDTSSADFARAYARWHRMSPEAFKVDADAHLSGIMDLGFEALNVSGPLFDSWEEANHLSDLRRIIDENITYRRTIVKNGPGEEPIKFGEDDDGVKKALQTFSTRIGWQGGTIDLKLAHYLVNHKDGSTRGNLENPTISAGRFCALLNDIADDYEKSGRKTLIWQDPKAVDTDRIAMPVLDETIVDVICNHTGMSKEGYVEAMWEAEKNSLELIERLTDPKYISKREELRKYAAASRLSWDDEHHPWNDVGYLFANTTIEDIKNSDGKWAKFLKAKGFDEEGFMTLSKYGQTALIDMFNKLHNVDSRKKLENDSYLGTEKRAGSYQTSDKVTGVMRNVVTLSRLMAVANPGVAIGNLAGRASSQTAMELFLDIGARYKIGPMAYGAENALSKDVVNFISGDETLHKTWNTLRKISLLGEDLEAIASSDSATKLLENLDKVIEDQTAFQRFATRGFDFANGGEFLTKQQTRLFFKRLTQFMSAEPALNVYFQQVPGENVTLLEKMILENPSKFLLDCFNKNGHPELFLCAQQAMNSALTGDMAQRHFLASWLHHLASQTTFGDFLFSTTICKFPKYQFNLVGKYMNWFAPMSTTYMLLTRAAQKIDEKWAETHSDYTPYHFELDQRFVNVKEAMAYDMTHMGAAPLAAILAMVGNAFEPPDDEKKWGDPDEWMFCGMRVGESWWLTDMLGAFIPSILWIRSCVEGKPTTALLVNGTMSACYSNPFLRATDCVNVLLDWDEGTLMDYEHTKELYADAEGGAPGFLDWVQANSAAGLANWATSLVTPSIIKEIYRNSETYEKSYNRVYQTTKTGKLSEAGEQGYTQKTDYQDAMLRKFCRSNPMLAIALDLLHPGAPTGYLLSEMPDTIYTDPAQAAQAEKWSVEGLDEQQADDLMWEIYLYMDSRSVDELQQSGFYLDKKTLYAFGSWLWDAYYRLEDEWEKRGANGELSYTVLGNGDWEKGKQIYNELLNDKKQHKQRLYDMYYDKVKNSYLNRGMQTYRRYATSYRTDSEGNLYATGFHRQGVLPFLSAPGTMENPEGTAGYENDFQSISPVTGQPLGQRALVPVDSESMELPAFEGFSSKGDGQGYSGKWSKYTTDSSTPKTTTSYSSGGGGGYSRRSSSSSSSYVPGISSRNYTPNMPNAAVGRISRNYDAQFDYLRPNVETKGSRDAYKRGDI